MRHRATVVAATATAVAFLPMTAAMGAQAVPSSYTSQCSACANFNEAPAGSAPTVVNVAAALHAWHKAHVEHEAYLAYLASLGR